MNILIDMQNLRFVHKHPHGPALLFLAEIEMPHIAVRVEPCDCDSFLRGMSDMEMFLLYKNSLGEHPKYVGDKLRAVLIECVNRMPETQLNIDEVRMQAGNISANDKRQYKYIRGATHAQCLEDLFDIPALVVTQSTWENTIALNGPRYVAQELFPGVNYDEDYRQAIDHIAKSNPLAPTPVDQEELFAIMDSIMEDAGTPSEPDALAKVMQDIVDALVESFNLAPKRAQNEFILWARARASLA
jgi:hypothetical protein